MDVIRLYEEEFINKQFERKELFEALQAKYNFERALYPGSYVHVTPSFYIPKVVYVDSFKKADTFFKDRETVTAFIENNKAYPGSPTFDFIFSDYARPLDLEADSFDLLISQWAGPISQRCKRYLKPGGLLLANNSHADAGIAYLDPDYQLEAVVNNSRGKFTISETDLDAYFIPKKDKEISLDFLLASGKGIGYTKTAENYLFKLRK